MKPLRLQEGHILKDLIQCVCMGVHMGNSQEKKSRVKTDESVFQKENWGLLPGTTEEFTSMLEHFKFCPIGFYNCLDQRMWCVCPSSNLQMGHFIAPVLFLFCQSASGVLEAGFFFIYRSLDYGEQYLDLMENPVLPRDSRL